MAQIDIEIVIDAVTLAQTPSGTWNNPTNIGSWSTPQPIVYMISEGCFVVSSQAGTELNVSANVGDEIRWSVSSPSDGLDYSVVLYNANISSGQGAMSQPQYFPMSFNYYNLQSGGSGQQPVFGQAPFTGYIWSSNILQANTQVTYQWYFAIINTATGSVVGYYMWDPFVTIGN